MFRAQDSSMHSNNEPLCSRRALLKAGLLGCGAVALGWTGEDMAMSEESKPASDSSKPGWIDAHVHVWTPDVERYPLAPGFKREQMQPPSFTPEELLALARPCGVDRIVLIQMSFYRFDNSYMLDTIRRFPGVFSGVAIVDDSTEPRDKMRELAKHGVRGFRIHPGKVAVDRWLGSPGMSAMWQCAADEGLAICPLINPEALPAIDTMCMRYPQTRVVIDHFARVGIDGTIRESDLAQLAGLSRHKHTHVKTSAFYALGKKQAPYEDLGPMIRRLVEAYGPERLMWATDCPFQVQNGHTYSASIELIRDRLDFLSASDREWLLRKTAAKIFFEA
jgi:predicted TIM-barrel fold metal-dependent hydrolase